MLPFVFFFALARPCFPFGFDANISQMAFDIHFYVSVAFLTSNRD